MPRNTIWRLVSIFMMLALVLAACSPAAETTVAPTEVMTEVATEEATEAATEEATEAATEAATEVATEAATEEQMGGSVSVLAVWGGEELDNFLAMVAPFEEKTGITVEFEGTRDLNAVLTSRVEGGNPPDLAGLPGPGQLLELARNGALVPLDEVLDMNLMAEQYDEGFLNLATVDGQLYGIFIKGAVKSLVWYNPKAFEAAGYTVPASWEELRALEDQIIADGGVPWCVGLESGAASGWPGTDWIEDIMLRTAGTEAYDQWYKHEIPWTDESVRNAWATWGEIVGDETRVYGGGTGALSTPFGESPFPMFEEAPGCYMHRQASFITSFILEQYPDLVAGEDYNFFTFPAIDEAHGNPLLVAGDLFGMFNDTPQARALMNYLVTAEAQEIWAARGGYLSANRSVDPSVYPDQLTQQIAGMIAEADAVRFDASDLMPEAVNSAFWTGILDFVSDPDDLDSILQTIEDTAADAYGQ